MANQDHVEILNVGVEEWNMWRLNNPSEEIDLDGITIEAGDVTRLELQGADFGRVNCRNAAFKGALLDGANFCDSVFVMCSFDLCEFTGADLRGASFLNCRFDWCAAISINATDSDLMGSVFSNCDFDKSDFFAASLESAVFRECSLNAAELYHADLSFAVLTGCDVAGVNFDQAVFHATSLTQTKGLSKAKNLDTIVHSRPSFLDISSLLPIDGISLNFLQGIGLSDDLIDYVFATHSKAIQFYPCFISYSKKDHDFAVRLHTDLQSEGVRCWFAPEDLKIGEKVRHTIHEAIRIYDKLLLILSADSIKSSWVESEVERAMKKELETGKPVLFPIRLDDSYKDVKAGWVNDVETRHIGDFTRWKEHDEYQKAFTRLLRDLKKSLLS